MQNKVNLCKNLNADPGKFQQCDLKHEITPQRTNKRTSN